MIESNFNPDWINESRYTKVRPCGNGYFVYSAPESRVYQIRLGKRLAIPAERVPLLVKWIMLDPKKATDEMKGEKHVAS